MNSFAMLADPARRRVVEILSDGERSAGEIGAVIMADFGISQPAVSNHLKVLRDGDIVAAERRGSHQVYRLAPGALDDVADWVERYSTLWPSRLDALETELARGARRERTTKETP